MKQDSHLLLAKRIHEVLPTHPLTPVATRTTTKAISQPKAVVIVPLLSARAATVVTILVEEPSTGRGTLRGALGVSVGIHINAIRGSLEEGLVADGPADDADVYVAEREGVEAVEPLEPELVLLGCLAGDFFALGLGDGGV